MAEVRAIVRHVLCFKVVMIPVLAVPKAAPLNMVRVSVHVRAVEIVTILTGVKTFVAVLDVARAMKTVVCATAATTTLMIIVTRRASAVDLVGATVVNSPPEATQCRVKTTL